MDRVICDLTLLSADGHGQAGRLGSVGAGVSPSEHQSPRLFGLDAYFDPLS